MVGVQHLPEKGVEIPLLQVVIHENFKNLLSDDIALLKLRDPISWSRFVQPVCLPHAKLVPSVGTLCWAIVWGRPQVKGEWWQVDSKARASSERSSTRAPSLLHSRIHLVSRHVLGTTHAAYSPGLR